MGVEEPEICTVDNCCSSRNCIVAVSSNIHVALDVWHFIRRCVHISSTTPRLKALITFGNLLPSYLADVLHGTTNPVCAAVAQDISEAILKTVSIDGKPAKYRELEDQKSRLEAVYQKYEKLGGVWSRKAKDVRIDCPGVNIADYRLHPIDTQRANEARQHRLLDTHTRRHQN